MSWLRPTAPPDLARLVADALVIAADPDARGANPFYWHRLEPLTAAVSDLARTSRDGATAAAAVRLQDHPTNPEHHRALVRLLVERLARDKECERELIDKAWSAAHRGRIGHYLGDAAGHPAMSDTDRADPAPPPAPVRTAPPGSAAQIIIPFRDTTASRYRLKNLLSCLHSLRDQEPVEGGYTVTVVETDDIPRWRREVEEAADEYLFARYAGPFNRSWATNVGAMHTSVRADTVCVLDADLLVDRRFVARNVDRFKTPGVGAVLAHRDLLYLDAVSSARAVHARCAAGVAEPDLADLRGFTVRCAVGACMWMLREVFDRIHGMDERYEGWGGEDMELALRLQLAAGLRSCDDTALHLHHPVNVDLVDGETVNAPIPWFSWQPQEPIGQLDRYGALVR